MVLSATQLGSLKLDKGTQEVYLPLHAPHNDIIITPMYPNDATALVRILGDLGVSKYLRTPPYPYTIGDAEAFISRIRTGSEPILNAIQAATDAGESMPAKTDGCPVTALRKVHPDGSRTLLGGIGIIRSRRFIRLRDPEKEAEAVKVNQVRGVGDPGIIWEISYWLDAEVHGKGVVSAAVKTLINDWAIPRMNAEAINGGAYESNVGSRRVLEKNGFQVKDFVENAMIIAEEKGGGVEGIYCLEWRKKAGGE